MDAVFGFQVFGATATPMIPELARLLADESVPESAVALGAIGIESLPILAKALNSAITEVRLSAVVGLGLLGTNAVTCTPSLIELTKDRDWRVRAVAIRGLSETSPSCSVITVFIGRLKDTNHVVRKVSAEALGKLGKDAAPAISALEEAALDSSEYVRKQAISSLETINSALGVDELLTTPNELEYGTPKY